MKLPNKNKKYSNIFHVLVATLLLCLTACSQIFLHQGLNENDANEILVALHDKGIKAQKVRVEKSQAVTWSVQVEPKDEADARKILVENNLPKVRQLGFSGICKEKALIPTPEEEKCRRLLALKGEIINSLESVPGVIEADVVLNIPEVSEFAVESQPNKHPTASAVVKVRRDSNESDLTEAKVQRFISNTVENLDPRDVAAIITYVGNPETVAEGSGVQNFVAYMGLKLAVESKTRFKLYALSALGVFILLSASLLFAFFRMTQLRKQSPLTENDTLHQNEANAKLLGQAQAQVTETPLISETGSQNSKY